MHYISHSSSQSVLSVGIGQDIDQNTDYHCEGDCGGVVLPHQGQAYGSFESDVGVEYFIEAFDFCKKSNFDKEKTFKIIRTLMKIY